MTEYIVIAIVIAWYTFALVVSETVGKKTKMGVQWLFFFSVMFTPHPHIPTSSHFQVSHK